MLSLTKPLTILAALAALVIIIAGLKAAAIIIVPFLIAVVLAVLASNPLLWLMSKGVHSILAVLIVISLLAITFFVFGYFLSSSIDEISLMMPSYRDLFALKYNELVQFLAEYNIQLSDTALFDQGAVQQMATTLLKSAGGMVTNALIVFFILFFILFEVQSFPKKLGFLWKHGSQEINSIQEVLKNINHYIAIKTGTSLLTGLIVGVFTAVLGLDFAFFLGILAFVLNFIPTIGSIIAAVPALFIAWLTQSLDVLLYTTIGYLLINNIISNLIEPKYMGEGLGLSTLIVFLSLIFWGWVFGPVGMLFSSILTMMIKILLQNSKQTEALAKMMGNPKSL